MKFTAEQLEKAKSVKTVEELIALAKEENIVLSDDEAQKFFDRLNKSGELADCELSDVAGGGCDSDVYDWINKVDVSYNPAIAMYMCPNCDNGEQTLSYYGYEYGDEGNYDKYKCEKCGKWYRQYTSGCNSGLWFKY